MDDIDRQHFIPLLSWGKTTKTKVDWVAQPYIKADKTPPTIEQIKTLYTVLDKYDASEDVHLFSYASEGLNCMVSEGTPKIYDWGINKYNPWAPHGEV